MDQPYSKDVLEKLYTNYLSEPLRTKALENLRSCECNALGGDNCKCRNVHPEKNGFLSDFNPFFCKLAPEPAESRLEKELQVTSSNLAKSRKDGNGDGPAIKPKHKLVHYDAVDEATLDGDRHKPETRADKGARGPLHATVPEVANAIIPEVANASFTTLPVEKQKVLTKQNTFEPVYEGLRNPYIIVINNVNFFRDPLPRHGATADWANLQVFFDKAGFKNVHLYTDLKRQDMLRTLANIDNLKLCDHDSLICVIMSHGGEKGVMAWDRQYITVDQITDNFKADKFPSLITKPKLFFINACRGDMEDNGYLVPRGFRDGSEVVADDIKGELPVKLPSEADFLICYSTTKGHVSYREYFANPNDTLRYRNSHGTGSWFIQAMVEVFSNYSDKEDLLSMLTRVNRAMCEFYNGGSAQSGHKQIACHLSMLTRKLYFRNFFVNGFK